MQTLTIKAKDIPQPKRSCKTCLKADVCLIIRTITGLAGQFKNEKGETIAPFKAEDFASVCGSFVWAGSVNRNEASTIDDVLKGEPDQ